MQLTPNFPELMRFFEIKQVPDSPPKEVLCFNAVKNLCLEKKHLHKFKEMKGAVMGLCNEEGESVFSQLLAEGKLEVIQNIIDNRFQDPLSSNEALHEVIRRGRAELIASLIQNGTKVNKQDGKGMTPIHVAIEKGREDILKELLSFNATCKPFVYEKLSLSPSQWAIVSGQSECFDILGKHKKVSWNEKTPGIGNLLHLAINFGQTDFLDHLFTKYSEQAISLLEEPNEEGRTPFLFATALGDMGVIYSLHEKGANAHVRDGKKRSALEIAKQGGYSEVCDFLVEISKVLSMDEFHHVQEPQKKAPQKEILEEKPQVVEVVGASEPDDSCIIF